jgi:flavin prenyltransferase
MIENELKLARAGAIILPASPGFYSKPTTIAEMIDFVVGKVLDQLGQENSLFHRWG